MWAPIHPVSFKNKIFLGICLPLILFCVILGGYMIQRIEEDAVARLNEKGTTLTKLLAKISAIPLMTYDYWSLEEYIAEILIDKEILYAVILDRDNNRITKNSSRPEGLAGRENKIYTAEIQHEGIARGRVEIGVSTLRYRRELRNDTLFLGGLLLFTLILCLFVSLVVSRTVTKPVNQIAALMKEVEQGIFSVRTSVKGRDELALLANGFNHMLMQIERRERELEMHRNHLEEQVAKRTRELARANNELQDFAHIASHDLQEPLRKVVVFGNRLKTKNIDKLDAQSLDYLERLLNATERMQALINGLLVYSRVTTKANPFEQVDLFKTVEGVLADLEVRIEQEDAMIDIKELPVIDADPLQMRQLFQNLLGNALKYRKPDEKPNIVLSAHRRPGDERLPLLGDSRRLQESWEISVADNGIGFEQKNAEKIFEVFLRLHGRNEYEGTGIGLAVCKKIVARHHGHISARAEPGKGATFTVIIPAHQAPGGEA